MDKITLKAAIQQNRLKNLSSSTKQTMPSIPQMAKNLKNDIVKNVKSVVSGNPLNITHEEANSRKAICNTCEFYDKNGDRCTKCGCFMAVKTYLKASSCPVGKW
jgi:hydroxymethylpyrimidine pyrophosphatase-like HAD family hydrolase